MAELSTKDFAYRRRKWLWIGFTIVSGSTMLLGMYLWMRRLNASIGTTITYEQYSYQLAIVRLVLYFGIAAIASTLAILLLKWSRDTRAQHLWPPKGLQIAADIAPKYGKAAEIIAKRLERSACGLGILAIAMLAWTVVQLGPMLH